MNRTKELIIILFLVGLIAYIPSFFGGFVWDDEDFVYANRYVAELRIDKFFTENAIAGRGKVSNYYRPIQFTLYALLARVGGFQPWLFHAMAIMLHIIATVLVFYTLYILTNKRKPALLTSFVFLIHPVQTESVSYISGLSDQLYTIFFFVTILLFLKKGKNMLFFPLSICLYIVSLLSKELALVLPGILFLITVFFRQKTVKRNLLYVSVYALIACLYLILRFTVLEFMDISLAWKGSLYGQHMIVRVATFFHNFWTYLGILVFPKDLFMERDHSIPIMTSIWNWYTVFFIIGNALLLFVLRYVFKNKKGINLPLFFWLGFLACLIPYTGIFLLNGIFYEHYLYLPMIFFWGFFFSFPGDWINHKVTTSIIAVMLLLFLIRSYARQWDWLDDERFYRQTLTHAPTSTRIINGLGMSLASKDRCNEAVTVYSRAIRLNPDIPNFYHNIANCYVQLNRNKDAENYYLKAIKVSPDFSFSYMSLLTLYIESGQKDKARQLIEKHMLDRFYQDRNKLQNLLHNL